MCPGGGGWGGPPGGGGGGGGGGPGDTGWDVFSLDYTLPSPLGVVLGGKVPADVKDTLPAQDCMSLYRIIFHMLFRLKRVSWQLNGLWKDLVHITHVYAKETKGLGSVGVRKVLHRCYLNTHTMMHVVNNLHEYLMFEVLEVAWCTLQEHMKTKVREMLGFLWDA